MDNKTKLILYFTCLVAYLALNTIAFVAMGMDKRRAQKHAYRIPEKMLFLWAGLFGGVGGTLGMAVFHHKTQHWTFRLFFPLMAIVQLALLIWGNAALLIA